MFPKLLEVQAKTLYQLFLRYGDGTNGIVDVSYLAGRGVFKQWDVDGLFFKVAIDKETGALVWNENLDLDPDSLYLRLTDQTFEALKTKSGLKPVYAAN